MSFRFHFREPVEEEFRLLAARQLEASLSIARSADSGANVPHEIRKHCKKLRALLRLVRGSFPAYEAEQRIVRDAGRELAVVREVAAHREALGRLRERDPERYGIPELERANDWLGSLQASDRGSREEAAAIARAVHLLEPQRARVESWRLTATGFDALKKGLAQTYRQGRKALILAHRTHDPEHLHEMRKYVKHHRVHLELLQPLWKRPIGAVLKEVEALGELLGEHHDLHVLTCALTDASRGTDRLDPEWMARLVRPEMRRLEHRIYRQADRAFAESPKELCRRFGRYWAACARRRATL